MLRGLTPADVAALERATERRRAAMGGAFVSGNTVLLSLLRAALAREDESGVIDPSTPRSTP